MPLPSVTVDQLRLRQVLFNLLANALQHTPHGGEISVTSAPRANEVMVSVKDTGARLDADQLVIVFDRFYRADKPRRRETGGTGLGLAIVKAIVEAHGGHVKAPSEDQGRGSTFSVFLPRG